MLLVKPDLRKTYGEQGRKWVLENFQPEIIWEGLYKNYMELLKEKELV